MAKDWDRQGWAVKALGSLAHDSRLQVHRLLVRAGKQGLSAGAIAAELGMPASSLSFHLMHLQATDMVRQRREGRSLIYSVNFDCMNQLMEYLRENCCQGVQCRPTALRPAKPRQKIRA